MELTPAQKKIVKDNHRFRVINAGRRTGKTFLAIEEMIGFALYREARIAYIAPTYQQARDIAWEQLKKRLQDIDPQINESRLEIRLDNSLGSKSLIMLRGWESIETLRGQAFDFIVIDEVAMMRYFQEKWQEVVLPTLTDKQGSALFISTPKGFNHFYDLYNAEANDPNFKSFHFTTYDNPHISKEEIDNLKSSMTEDAFAQEYMGDFRKQVGLVYKEFNRFRHIYDDHTPDVAETLVGVDFGFTNPTAILTIKKDRDGHFWVTDELYKTEMTQEVIEEYLGSLPHDKCYPDPASPQAIEGLRKKGVNIMEVTKGADSINIGISKVRELFKSGRIHIHSSCANLIWELENYRYPDKKPSGSVTETPMKEHDHACDALRYVLMTNDPKAPSLMKKQRELSVRRRNNRVNYAR